jgi:hypothetical protein
MRSLSPAKATWQSRGFTCSSCSQGIQVSGRGTITRSADGCTFTLAHNGPNQKKVNASINTCNHTGQATLTMVMNNRVVVFSIKDGNTTNNTCSCP